ncbi:MAG: radical SAM/SPASM domain-containing protein [Myxococcota bacterium]
MKIAPSLYYLIKYTDRRTFRPKEALNRWRLATDYLRGREVSAGFPKHLRIELTNRCNLACIMCPITEMERKLGNMDMDLFRKIVSDAAANGTTFVYLHAWGESTIHREMFDMVREAKKVGLQVGLSTNCTMLNEERAQAVVDSGLDFIVLSMDGAIKETYEKVRKNGDFEAVRQNITNMLATKARAGRGPFTVLQLIKMTETQAEVDAFTGYWKNMAPDSVFVKKLWTWDGKAEDINRLGIEEMPDAVNTVCHALWKQLVVHWNGEVIPCCTDIEGKLHLGNVREQSLREIWNGAPMRALRRAHTEGRRKGLDPCDGCVSGSQPRAKLFAELALDSMTYEKFIFTDRTKPPSRRR